VLMVVRRRRRTLVTVGLGLVTLFVLAAGGLYLIVPPSVPMPGQLQALETCPYDRFTWSNMPGDVDVSWQPCRRVARLQLALTLLGVSSVTVLAAVMATRDARSAAQAPADEAIEPVEPIEPVLVG
jgi:hypothetical protein